MDDFTGEIRRVHRIPEGEKNELCKIFKKFCTPWLLVSVGIWCMRYAARETDRLGPRIINTAQKKIRIDSLEAGCVGGPT